MSQSAAAHNSTAPHYFVPQPSTWPIFGSFALFFMALGTTLWMNDVGWGKFLLIGGLCILFYMMFGWFGEVIRESEGGLYSKRVDVSFRWSMGWFIFSEVMFFAAFFGVLFYMRVISVPDLGSLDNRLLWPDFTAGWPLAGPGIRESFETIPAFGLPAINTMLLLLSGVTITLAHWALIANNRPALMRWMIATIALGTVFLFVQGYEYVHAWRDLNLQLDMGAYGATFFMLTGFHGFHVTIGTIMLIVITVRCSKGHFTPENHFGFEGVAWYWHFVDVVWLLLFVVVYAM
ncbi:MAG: cytochrome c oxidase subunit 3 [Burkholderiales bacterium]|jgi:cytochrome c oxidase subunit III|nr:cytochrome c oxidase subunit 3 [Burkholderiales bacterium]